MTPEQIAANHYRECLQIAARNIEWNMIQEYLMRGETAEARAIVWC